MHFKSILEQTLDYKGFVFKKINFGEKHKGNRTIIVEIEARKGSQPICSVCQTRRPGYDKLKPRQFEYIPFWGYHVFFIYAPRRVDCPTCGVRVEEMPWSNGKNHHTKEYSWFLSRWVKKLSMKEVAECFQTTWYHVYQSVEMAVEWGRERMELDNIHSIGVDEVLWHKGHKYLTVVYQIDAHCKRLLWIGKERSIKTFQGFFKWLGKERTGKIKFVCSDMWRPYLEVINKEVKNGLHILDRFHIISHMNKAIDEVRATEVKELKKRGENPFLRNSRWIFLKRPKNLTTSQDQKLAQLLKLNLKTVRSYLLKEDFQKFWEYVSPYWAEKFLNQWRRKAMYSRIEPMKKIAKMLGAHKPLILNWFRARKTISSGIVEGFNNKLKLTFKKSYGFKTYEVTETILYHALSNLPVPMTTHTFF